MKARGFTLIELLVALAIIATLLSLVTPRYFGSLTRADEAVLRENLYLMRDAIDKHFADTGRYPASLEELATKKYLRAIPIDPFTQTRTSWIVIPPEDPQLAAFGELWSHARQREKEAEMIWIGNQFKQAIGSYYQRSPGTVKRYPEKLENLLQDHRFLTVQRHLRTIYPDPMTGRADWIPVLAPSDGVMGVRSAASLPAIFLLNGGSSYTESKFVYEPSPSEKNAATFGAD